jgi:hypothetical protein
MCVFGPAPGTFRDEARNVDATYTPKTVNTDGWKATQNAWHGLFPLLAVVLCFLHGFLKIRDRIRKDHELHRRIALPFNPRRACCIPRGWKIVLHPLKDRRPSR